MAEAFRFYRDELKLHVYPVDGPWSKKADPGKKPAVASWWNYDPAECDVAEFFKPQRCHNIGVCPTGKLYIVDLDSKTDQGESVYEFIASKPALAKIPRHRTRGGCHLVFFCEDVPPIRRPRSNKPYDKALFSPVSDKVGAEFYHNDHQNVVFPPSTHVVGLFKYEWEVMGEIPTVSWKWVVETFGFKLPGEREEKPKKEDEIPFHENFKGDFKFLDLVRNSKGSRRADTARLSALRDICERTKRGISTSSGRVSRPSIATPRWRIPIFWESFPTRTGSLPFRSPSSAPRARD